MNFNHYHELKKEYPGTVLLFRVGDFHELYFEDAEQASKVLGLTLTTRGKNTESPVAMAGFPHHQLDAYLQKLVKAGFRVSIVDGDLAPEKPKTKVTKWKPNTACVIVMAGAEVEGNEIDVVLAEKLCGEEAVLITRDSKGRRGEFNLTHRLTGLNLLRANKSYEETRRIGELFWNTLQEHLKEVYRTSEVLAKLVDIPYDLKFLLRTGSFPQNASS